MILYYLIFVMPAVALVSALLYAPCYIHCRCTQGPRGAAFHLAKFALIGCLLSQLYLTILCYWPDISFTQEYHFLNLQPFAWLTEGYTMGLPKTLFQVGANIAMFVPLGFLLPVAAGRMRSFPKTALAVLAVTVSIETTQYFIGRSADIDDVIMNFFGGILGYGLFALCRRLLRGCHWWLRMLEE